MRKIISCALLLVIFKSNAIAQIRINEFLIDPDQSAEIINIGSASADISSWIIDDNGGTTFYTIPEESILFPNSCLVFTGSFNLNKSSSDTIRLFNGTTLIDSFTYSTSPGANISFRRIPDGTGSFSTGSATLGKFNALDQICVITPTPTPTNEPAPTPTPTPKKKATPTPTDEEFEDTTVDASNRTNPTRAIEIYNLNGTNRVSSSEPQVLGETVVVKPNMIYRLMALLALSYSALTVLSFFLRIKLGA